MFQSCSIEFPKLKLRGPRQQAICFLTLGPLEKCHTPRTVLDPRDFGFPNTRRRFYLLAKLAHSDHDDHDGHGCPDGPPAVPPQRVEHFLKARGAWQFVNLMLYEAWVDAYY